MADAAHSFWSPSGFKAVMLCPGKTVLEAGLPDSTSVYAAEGTAAHHLLTMALEQELQAADWMGDVIHVNKAGRVVTFTGPGAYFPDAEWTFKVDEAMAAAVQVCIDYVRELMAFAPDAVLMVDQRVHFHDALGVEEGTAYGTLDVAVVIPSLRRVYVIDFKYGMGVEVSAGTTDEVTADPLPNPQMALYAEGILAAVEDMTEIDEVHLAISQPRITRKPAAFSMSRAELGEWVQGPAQRTVRLVEKAQAEGPEGYLVPGEDQCRWCKAKATCPALRDEVAETVSFIKPASPEEFAERVVDVQELVPHGKPEWLAACLSKVDLIEDWCKAIRAEADRRLNEGQEVPGWKLVAGKRSARAWGDAAEAEKMLREVFRLPVEKAYDLKLISPTSAEKLAKAGDIGPRQWPKLAALITQTEGKPHVAPASDPRPALVLTPVVEDFTDLSANDFA